MIFIVAVLETTLVIGVPLPGEILLVGLVGTLAPEWVVPAGLLAAAGCLTGQVIGFVIGHRYGPALRTGWVGRRAGERAWVRAERLVRRSGGLLLIVARFVAVAHTLAPPLAGTLRMPFRRFVVFAGVSALLWSSVWTLCAWMINHLSGGVDQDLISWVLLVGGIVLAAWVIGGLTRDPAPPGGQPLVPGDRDEAAER